MKVGGMKIGNLAFLAGLGLAVLSALVNLGDITVLLLVTGGIVGFLNIKTKESLKFLVAVIALPIASGAIAMLPQVGGMLQAILTNIVIFTGVAAVIVALKVIYAAGKG